jgi:hypothetical protein
MTVICQKTAKNHNLLKQNNLGFFASNSLQELYVLEITCFRGPDDLYPPPPDVLKLITAKSACSKSLCMRAKMF